ncbi:bifunctional 3'-5' exonuclease/DNA polymerase [Arthrobacter rhombi]|uniref:bifunctional 3'-5' exonuclease/DNA polymerase n=1 Tax=Arthrobacter rhombi TaxID=71253 RepID=UPI0031CF1542
MSGYAVLATHSTAQAAPEQGAASAVVQLLDEDGVEQGPPAVLFRDQLPAFVRELEASRPRWVWDRTVDWYPSLLAAGCTVERACDLTLSRTILRHSTSAAQTDYTEALRAGGADREDADPAALPPARVPENQGALFSEPRDERTSVEAVAAEFREQQGAVPATPQGRRLQLLLAAESAGALVAAEMRHHGIPWRPEVHEALLADALGPRTAPGTRPARVEEVAVELRAALQAPGLNPDSPQELLRALHRVGIDAKSTGQWELREYSHPALEVLQRYKKLSRLHTANGWAWLDAWVHDGRFRPEYVVGGVVTGRWASRGGGALQIPHTIRDAVRPDAGHVLVVADAAQLEPRILAALGRDNGLADAARGQDLYQGIADQGFGGDRAHAKIAMLGAMYGSTTGEAGRLMPQLTRTFPAAIGVLERAARIGQDGGVVGTWLGRCSPAASERWLTGQRATSAEEQRRADSSARTRGRFTRNFVVQGTAAEWALCWLADIRLRLRAVKAAGGNDGELVFFLHDEVMLHVPAEAAERVSTMVQEAAERAATLMFGRIPVQFPVGVVTVDSYADAK